MQGNTQTQARVCLLNYTARARFVAVAVLWPTEHTFRGVSEILNQELLRGLYRPDPTGTNSSPGEPMAVPAPNQAATHRHTSSRSLPNHVHPCPAQPALSPQRPVLCPNAGSLPAPPAPCRGTSALADLSRPTPQPDPGSQLASRRHGLGCSHTTPGHNQDVLVMDASGSTRHKPS